MSLVVFPDGNLYDTTGLDAETVRLAIQNNRKKVEEENKIIAEAPEPDPGLFARTGQLLESGYRESVAAGAEGLAKLDDAILGKDIFDEQGLLDFAKRNREEARQIPAIKAIQEAEGVSDVFKSGASYLVQSLPEMSPMFAAGGLGFAIGGPMGAAIGVGLATIPKALPFLGRNIEEFKETNKKDPNQEELVGLLATAGVQSALDTAIAFIAPYTKVLKGSPSLATNLIKRAVQGTVIEGSTEFTQDALQILAANNYDVESLKSPESVYRLTEAALAGGLVGQQIGVVTAPFTKESPVRTGAKDDFEMAQAFKLGQKEEQPAPEVAPEEKTKETSIVDFKNAQGRNIVDSIYDTQRSESSTRTDEQLSLDAANNAALDEEINILNEALNSGDAVKVSDANEILNKPENQKRINDARKLSQSKTLVVGDTGVPIQTGSAVNSVNKALKMRNPDLLKWARENSSLDSRFEKIFNETDNVNKQALEIRRALKDLKQSIKDATKIGNQPQETAQTDKEGQTITDIDGNVESETTTEKTNEDSLVNEIERKTVDDVPVDNFTSVTKANEQREDDASIVKNTDGSIDNVATEQNKNRYKLASRYFDARLKDLSKRGTQGKMVAESIREQVLLNPERNAFNLVAAFAAADAAVEVLGKNGNVAINFLEEIEATDNQKKAHGIDVKQKIFATGQATRSTTEPLIRLAFTLGDPNTALTPEVLQQTAYHEAFHTLQNFYGKHKPKFKQLLKSYFGEEDTIIDGKAYKKLPGQLRKMMSRYNNPYHQALLRGDQPPTAREMQAQIFEAYKRGMQAGDPTPMGGLFGGYLNFAYRFFPRLKNLLSGYGFRSLQDLYESIPKNVKKFKTPKDIKTQKAKDALHPPKGVETPQEKQFESDKRKSRVETLEEGNVSDTERPSENKLNIDEKEVDASILKSTIKNPVLPYDPMTNNRDMTLNQVKEAFEGDIHYKGYSSNIIAVADFPNELRQSTMDDVYKYYENKLKIENPRAFFQYEEADNKFVELKVNFQRLDLKHRDGPAGNQPINDVISNYYRQHFKLPEKQKDPLVYDVSFTIDEKLSQFDENDRSVYQGYDYNNMPRSSLLDIMAKITSAMRDFVDESPKLNGFTFSPFGKTQRETETKRRLYNTVISSKQFKAMFPELGQPFTVVKSSLTQKNYDIILPTKNSQHSTDSAERADMSKAAREEINNHVDNDEVFQEMDASIAGYWNRSALNPLSDNFDISNPVTGRVELADADRGEISTLFEVNVKSQEKPLRLVVYHVLPSLKVEGNFGETERIAVESNLMSMRNSLSSQEMAAIMANFDTDTKLLKTDFTVNGAFGTTEQKVTSSEAIDIMNKVMASTKFAWDYYKDRSNGLLNMGNSEKKNDFYVRLFSDFTRQDGTVKPSAVREQLFPDLKKPVPYTMEGILESDIMDTYNTGSIVPIKQIDGIKKESKAFQDLVHKRINLQQYVKMLGETRKDVLDRTNDDIMYMVNSVGVKQIPNTRLNNSLKEPRIETIIPPTEDDAGIITYNGGGGTFIKFKTSMIGKGEGAIAFGWGLYFADLTGTGLSYALQKVRSGSEAFSISKDPNQAIIVSLNNQKLLPKSSYAHDEGYIDAYEGSMILDRTLFPVDGSHAGDGAAQAMLKTFTGKMFGELPVLKRGEGGSYNVPTVKINELPDSLGTFLDFMNEKKIDPTIIGKYFKLNYRTKTVATRTEEGSPLTIDNDFILVKHKGKVGFLKGMYATRVSRQMEYTRSQSMVRRLLTQLGDEYVSRNFHDFDGLKNIIESKKRTNVEQLKKLGVDEVIEGEGFIESEFGLEFDRLETQGQFDRKILLDFYHFIGFGRDQKIVEYVDELDFFQENDYARDELIGSFDHNKVDTVIDSINADTSKVDMSQVLKYVKKAYDEDRIGVPQAKLDKFNFRNEVARLLKAEKTDPSLGSKIKQIEKAVVDNVQGLFNDFKKIRLDELKQEIQFLNYFLKNAADVSYLGFTGKENLPVTVQKYVTQVNKEYETLYKIQPFKNINAQFNRDTSPQKLKSSLRKVDLEVDSDLQEGNLFKFEVPVSAQKLLDTHADREIFTAQTANTLISIPLFRILRPFHSGKLDISFDQRTRKDGDLIDTDYYFPNKIAQFSENNRTPMQDTTSNYDNANDYNLGKNTGQFDEKAWREQYGKPLEILTKSIRKYNGDPKKVEEHADKLLSAYNNLDRTERSTLRKEKLEGFQKIREGSIGETLQLDEKSRGEALDKISQIIRERVNEIENDFKREYFRANNPTNLKLDAYLNKIKELLIEVPRFGRSFTQQEADILNIESAYKQFITSPVYAYMFKNFIKDPIYEKRQFESGNVDIRTNQINARSFYENLEEFFGGQAQKLGSFNKFGQLYKSIALEDTYFEPPKQASMALNRLGFVGHRYNEAGSRRASAKGNRFGEENFHNYVIYDENIVTMLESNGSPIANTQVIDTDIVGDVNEDAAIIFQAADPRFTNSMQSIFADPRRETLRYKVLNSLTPLNTLHKRFGRAFVNQAIFGLRPLRDREAQFAYDQAVNRGDPNPQRKMLTYGEGAFRLTEMAQNTTGRNQMLAEEGSFTLSANGTPMLNPNTKGLIEIFRPIGQGADYMKFSHYVVAKRAQRLLQEGRERLLTDQQISEGLAFGQANPLFEQVFQEYNKFNKSTIDFMVSAGAIDRETANNLTDTADYVPFYRIIENEEYTEGMFGAFKKADPRKMVGTTSGFDNPDARVKDIFKELKGGTEKIGDLYTNIFSNQQAMISAALKNLAMQRVVLITEGNKANGMYRGVQAPKHITKQQAQNNRNHFTYREDGKTKYYDVGEDGELLTALRTFEPVQMQGLFKIMQKIGRVFRDAITATPGFMIANIIRGEVAGLVTVDAPLIPLIDTAKGLKNALTNSETIKEMKTIGGFGGYNFGDVPQDQAKRMKRLYRNHEGYSIVDTPQRLSDMFFNLIDRIQSFGEATELATRDGVYRANLRNGMDKATAAHEALNLINFNRRGNPTSFAAQTLAVLLPLVPFLNARLQGLYRTGTAMAGSESNGMRTALKGATLMGLSVALYGIMSQRDEWDDEPLYRKLNYYIIYIGDKKFLIPKPFEIGAIFSTLPEVFLDGIRNKDGEYVSQAVQQLFLNNFSFNPVPQAVLPLLEVGTNYDFFRGRDLESMGVRGLPTNMRSYSSTSEFAKLIGQASSKIGISPIEVEQLVNGYFGSMGSLFLTGTDAMLSGMGVFPTRPTGIMGSSIGDPIADLLGISRFYKEREGDRASRWLSEFYDLKREVYKIYRGVNELRSEGEYEAARDYRRENKSLLVVRQRLNNMYKQLMNINERMGKVKSSTLSATDKYNELKKLTIRRNQVAKKVEQIKEKIRESS